MMRGGIVAVVFEGDFTCFGAGDGDGDKGHKKDGEGVDCDHGCATNQAGERGKGD